MSTRQEVGSTARGNIAGNSATIVDQAEKAFLKRSFKRALHLSNQFLLEEEEQKQNKNSRRNSQGIISIHIPCTKDDILPLGRVGDDIMMKAYDLTIDITKTTRPDPRDRALGVALQSWFEISQSAQEDGAQFLVPFCRSLTGGAPVTIELLLILLRFYIQMGQPGWSICVATACLSQCRWSPQLVRYSRDCNSTNALKEISEILLLELLPFHPHAVRTSVECLNCENTNESQTRQQNTSIWNSAPSEIRKETLETLISAMNSAVVTGHADEAEWFQTSLQDCSTKWKGLINDLEKKKEEISQNSMVVRMQKQFNPSTLRSVVTKQFETQSVLLLRRLKGLLLQCQTTWKNGALDYKLAGVAAAFGFAVLAYRYHRRKLLALLRAAIYEAVVQPAKEIVEALKL